MTKVITGSIKYTCYQQTYTLIVFKSLYFSQNETEHMTHSHNTEFFFFFFYQFTAMLLSFKVIESGHCECYFAYLMLTYTGWDSFFVIFRTLGTS